VYCLKTGEIKKMFKFFVDEEDGVIIFRKDSPEEFYVPESESEEASRIRSCIAFFVYATQRDDWLDEFENFMVELQKKEDNNDEKKEKFSHLKLIKNDEEEKET
tara:strand:- start:179 stop:490 length:312 start_codon:yes stop_codon:yes gene_type:complete